MTVLTFAPSIESEIQSLAILLGLVMCVALCMCHKKRRVEDQGKDLLLEVDPSDATGLIEALDSQKNDSDRILNVQSCLLAKVDPNVVIDEDGNTVMHRVVKGEPTPLVAKCLIDFLLAANADPNQCNNRSEKPVDLLKERCFPEGACEDELGTYLAGLSGPKC